MLYLDYAKSVANGYILNFFADSEEDITEVSNGKHFITKNGTDYGVPQPSSTVVITMSDKTKKTYVLNEAGEWQEGGVEMDYSKLTNAPITLVNLADKNFIPEVNTYYEHLGETTEDFVKGIIYLYNGAEYKAIDGSGSGAGVQPDYDQNDPTQPDYIKNRPFYGSTTALFDENIVTALVGDLSVNGWETTSKVINENVGDEVKVGFNGVEYTQTVKDIEGIFRYVGNASIIEAGDDTEEPFFIILNIAYLSAIASGRENLVSGVTVFTQTAYNGEVKIFADNVKTIDPKYIKDMYYTKSESEVQKTLVFKGEINGFAENIPNIFEEGDMVSLKEPEVQLDVSVIAKYHSDESSSFAYIGNLALLDDLIGGTFPDTKEDYILVCGYDDENKTSMLIYGNKNCRPPHNIEVYKGKNEDPIVRIPEKYMPENVALKSYVDTAISNAITKTLNTEV